MDKVTIAVVIPTYNSASFVSKALDSVAKQTRLPSELIVVDDGSTDNTIEIIEKWRIRSPIELRIIEKENGGTASARNLAINNTSASHIALLDSDDQFLPRHLETLCSVITQGQDVVLAFSDAIREVNGIDDQKGFLKGSRLLELPNQELHNHSHLIQGSAFLGLLQGSRIATCSCIFHRETALEVNLFNSKLIYSEDRDFFLRMSKAGSFAYVLEKLSLVTIHGTNKETRQNRGNVRRGRVLMLIRLLDDHENLGLSVVEHNETKQELSRSISKAFYWSARDGLRTYVKWCREISAMVPNAKGGIGNFLRAVFWTLRRLKY